MQNGTITLQNSSVVSYKIKHSLTISPSKSTLSFPSNIKICLQKQLFMNFYNNVYGNFIHNHQKLVKTQIYLNRGMDELTVIHIHTTEY